MLELVNNYIGTLTIVSVCIIFGRFILKRNFQLKIFWVILIDIVCALILNTFYLFDFAIFRTVVAFLLYTLIFKYIFGMSWTKSVIATVIFFVPLFSGEILFFIVITFLFKISGNAAYIEFGGTLFGNALVGMFCLIISYFARNLINKLLEKNIKNHLIVYWALSLTCLILFLITVFSSSSLNIETCLVLGMIVVMLIIIFVSFYQTYKNSQLVYEYDNLLEFIKKYENEIDAQRTMRHETKNQLLIIKSKLVDKETQKNVIGYIDEILDDNNKEINHSEYARLRYLPSNGIKGLFYFKVSEAIDKKIVVNINISKTIEKSFIKDLNSNMFNQLGKVLGIFLDNAIESAEISENKEIGIEVYSKDGDVIFVISNTYTGNSPIMVGTIPISTKGINRGHGLLLARTIVNGNNRFVNETEVTDKLYIQKLIVKK